MKKIRFGRILLFIVIGALFLVGFRVVSEKLLGIDGKKDGSSSGPIGQMFMGEGQKNCESNPDPVLSAEFTDLSKIDALGAIGGITGGSPGRSYIGIKPGMEAPIYSPTDAVLENIVYARRGGPSTPGEFGLYIRVSCEVVILFDHIDRVSDKIRALAPKEPADTSRTQDKYINVPLKKGELLGYSDGTPQAHTFDFLLMNKSKPTTHLNTKRWQWEQAVYSQCPYDYFTSDLKAKYYAKIGEVGEISGVRSFMPSENCGELSHDKPGTASGGWFQGESTDTQGDYLAISRQGKRVDIALKKDGTFDQDSKFRDYAPKVYPENIRVGQAVCYQDYQNRWVFVKLVSDNQLSFAKGGGSCPATFPTAQATLWER